MKKDMILAAVVGALLRMTTPSQAYFETICTDHTCLFHQWDHASEIDFGNFGILDGCWIGTGSRAGVALDPILDWKHTLPAGYAVPPDQVDDAKLFIDAWRVDANNNEVLVQGVMNFTLNNHLLDNSLFTTASAETGFWNGGFLDVEITAEEDQLRVDKAWFVMDYTQGQEPGMPIPEPGTLALLGLELAGIGAVRRRFKS